MSDETDNFVARLERIKGEIKLGMRCKLVLGISGADRFYFQIACMREDAITGQIQARNEKPNRLKFVSTWDTLTDLEHFQDDSRDDLTIRVVDRFMDHLVYGNRMERLARWTR